jgi:hypothetical protein
MRAMARDAIVTAQHNLMQQAFTQFVGEMTSNGARADPQLQKAAMAKFQGTIYLLSSLGTSANQLVEAIPA